MFTYDWYNGLPADWPLITEVDATNGFVELTHFGPRPVDLGGWSLATPGGVVNLPRGTQLAPGKPLVVARDAAALRSKFSTAITVVELTGLSLDGRRGSVALRRSSRAVDELSWGAGGWRLDGKTPLCRPTPGKDTDIWLDWTSVARATPGVAGCGQAN